MDHRTPEPAALSAESVNLRPCPFCGGEARLMDMTQRARQRGYQYVECPSCGVDAGSVEVWNRRPHVPAHSADAGDVVSGGEVQPMTDVYRIALDTLRASAPGMSDKLREVVADDVRHALDAVECPV